MSDENNQEFSDLMLCWLCGTYYYEDSVEEQEQHPGLCPGCLNKKKMIFPEEDDGDDS